MAQPIDFLGYSITVLMLLGGTLLVLAEAIIPGAQFIVLGVALLVTGIIGFFVPAVGSSIPLLAGLLIVTGVATFLAYSKLDLYGHDGGAIGSSNKDDLVGIEGTVIETVTQDSGKVDLEVTGFSSEYQARTDFGEIEEGTKVRVTDGGGGSVVTVQEMGSPTTDSIDKELEEETN